VVQAGIVHQVHEDLAVSRVMPAGGNPDGAAHVSFGRHLVPGEGRVAPVLIGAGATALNHEVGDHAMKVSPS